MCVSHRDLKRANVVLCNVSTFGVPQAIRISQSSLRVLASVAPDLAPLPHVIPDSHGNEENSSAAGTSRSLAATARNSSAVVQNGARVAIHWTDEPVGWFNVVL